MPWRKRKYRVVSGSYAEAAAVIRASIDDYAEMFSHQHYTKTNSQIRVEGRDIHFGIVTHAAIVQIGGANRCPQVIDNSNFGMNVDRPIVYDVIFL